MVYAKPRVAQENITPPINNDQVKAAQLLLDSGYFSINAVSRLLNLTHSQIRKHCNV